MRVLAALKLHYPPKRVYVCSFHFIENKARELHNDLMVCCWVDANPSQSVCIMYSGLYNLNVRSFQG